MITPEQEERLAAWLDGALPLDERQAFQSEMATNAPLRALAQEWRENDRLIACAFAPIAQAEIDPALLSRMGLAEVQLARPANDNVSWPRWAWAGGALAAACVALVVFAGRGAPVVDPLSQALDSTVSLSSARLPDGRQIRPILTVRAADGRWCREYSDGATIALACRGENGAWTAEATDRRAGEPPRPDGVSLAGAADSAELESAYRRLGASDPVDAKTEAGLIGRRWLTATER